MTNSTLVYDSVNNEYSDASGKIQITRGAFIYYVDGTKITTHKGVWTLLKNGGAIDHDQYRSDLAERNEINLKSMI